MCWTLKLKFHLDSKLPFSFITQSTFYLKVEMGDVVLSRHILEKRKCNLKIFCQKYLVQQKTNIVCILSSILSYFIKKLTRYNSYICESIFHQYKYWKNIKSYKNIATNLCYFSNKRMPIFYCCFNS